MEVLVHQHHGVVNRFQFRRLMAIAVLALKPLQRLQLCHQAFPKVAGADPDRVHLSNQVNGFAQGVPAERYTGGLGARRH